MRNAEAYRLATKNIAKKTHDVWHSSSSVAMVEKIHQAELQWLAKKCYYCAPIVGRKRR